MANNVREIKSSIESKVSQLIANDLYDAATSIINEFYDSYSPTIYHRNYDLRDSVQKIIGDNFGGVNVTISPTAGSSRAPADAVYNLMWMQGIRGLPATGKSGWVNPHFMTFQVNLPEFEIIANTPHEAMELLVNGVWEQKRQPMVDDIVQNEINKLILI